MSSCYTIHSVESNDTMADVVMIYQGLVLLSFKNLYGLHIVYIKHTSVHYTQRAINKNINIKLILMSGQAA